MMKLSELAKRDFDRLKNDEKSLDFKIDSSSEIKSDVVFSRSELGDEFIRCNSKLWPVIRSLAEKINV